MQNEKNTAVVIRTVLVGIAAITFWGCQRKVPTPQPILPDDTAEPSAQATPTVSPSPQVSISPELLDDGLDEALKELDAVE